MPKEETRTVAMDGHKVPHPLAASRVASPRPWWAVNFLLEAQQRVRTNLGLYEDIHIQYCTILTLSLYYDESPFL